MRGKENIRFCNKCDYVVSADALHYSRIDLCCPRCGNENLIGNVYRFGDATHKRRRRLWELGEVKGAPLPIPPAIDTPPE